MTERDDGLDEQVIDDGDLRKYRTEIPNIIDDSSLSPRAIRLYLKYKRIAGDKGACWQSIRTLSNSMEGMSVGAVFAARKELLEKHWVKEATIIVNGEPRECILIRDVWLRNFTKYSERSKVEQEPEIRVQDDVQVLNQRVQNGVQVLNQRNNTIRRNSFKKEPDEEKRDANASPSSVRSTSLASQVRDVFAHWQTAMQKPHALLIAKRERAITNRLKEGYSVERLKLAVDGCRLSPHNMGENDRHTAYNDIELICRDGTHVERFVEIATGHSRGSSGAATAGVERKSIRQRLKEEQQQKGEQQ